MVLPTHSEADLRALDLELHRRVLGGDAAAAEALCARLMAVLGRWARSARPRSDPHDISHAINEVLLRYLDDPSRYDPSRGSLERWLATHVLNGVRDIERAARQRLAHELPAGLDLSGVAGAAPDDLEPLREALRLEHRADLLAIARDDRERAFVTAHLDAASIAAQAALLDLERLPERGQQRGIARTWKRLLTRCRRALARRQS